MKTTRREWTAIALFLVLVVGLAPGVWGGEKSIGKNPGKIKGRWLKVHDTQEVRQYDKVCLGEVTVDLQWQREGKETPIDEKLLDEKVREHLVENLKASGLFEQVLDSPPQGDVSGMMRLDTTLEVDPGSRAARYVVGFGAGKSKSILEIHLKDQKSDRKLGLYHGYGTGSGMGFKLAGGGARKMTQDDIQENAKKFVELLQQVM